LPSYDITNRVADDAAGLAISEKMRRQIRGLQQGIKNIQDGISVCQVMDGALNEVHDILHRMTELSIKGANGTLTGDDRSAIQTEISQLVDELDRTTASTTFNEKQLLTAVDITDRPVRPDSGKADIIFVIDNTGSMGSYIRNVMTNLSSFADALSNCNVQYGVVEYGDISEAIGECKSYPLVTSESDVIETLNNIRSNGGGDFEESALEAVTAALDFPFREDASAKEVILITDATYHYRGDTTGNPSELADEEVVNAILDKGVRLSVVTTSGCMDTYKNKLANGAVLNLADNFYDSMLRLANDIAEAAGEVVHKNPEDIIIQMSGTVDDTFTIHTHNISSESLGLSDLSCLTAQSSKEGIDKIHKALQTISGIRSQIGADQNALEHAYNLRNNVAENTIDAESRIRDTDISEEMVKFAKDNLLMQAGQSMLAQANQSNQGVLSLLG